MGINPDMLKMSMKVMKANPKVIKMAQEQMAKMSPEQMKQASDLAQQQMEAMSPGDLERMADDAIRGSGAAPEPVFGKMPFNFELLEDFSFSEKEKAGARRARPRALRRVIALFRPLCAAC